MAYAKSSVRRILGLLAILVIALSTACAPKATTSRRVNPPALWLHTSASPTEAELRFAATHYRVAVFNIWDTAALKRLKQLNPTIKVLAYQDLASTRSYAAHNGQDDWAIPTGVGYAEASRGHSDWFALAANGKRIQWSGYNGHWQMAVWNQGYQNRWVSNVTSRIVRTGFDGVLADNAMYTLQWYYGGKLAFGLSDSNVRSGLQQLVDKAGAALRAHGKLLVPNIGEARMQSGRWNSLARWGGGEDEMFLHWSDDPNSGYIGDWGAQGWTGQVLQMSGPGLVLARTNSEAYDDRSYRFGLASFWIGGGGTSGAFTATSHDGYLGTPFRKEQGWDFGQPVSGIQRISDVRYRVFQRGFAAANPSESRTISIPVPPGMVDANGRRVSTLSLGPLSGQVLRRG